MPPRRTAASALQVSDALFAQQVEATREALKTFTVIAALDAPNPAKVAMAELISVTVCCAFNLFRHFF